MARSILKEKAETQKKKKKKIKKLDYSPVYMRGENRHEFTAAVNPADGGISREFADLALLFLSWLCSSSAQLLDLPSFLQHVPLEASLERTESDATSFDARHLFGTC